MSWAKLLRVMLFVAALVSGLGLATASAHVGPQDFDPQSHMVSDRVSNSGYFDSVVDSGTVAIEPNCLPHCCAGSMACCVALCFKSAGECAAPLNAGYSAALAPRATGVRPGRMLRPPVALGD
jgi:hypothetical protein